MEDFFKKFGSRKFLLAAAGFLGGFGAGITGIVIGDLDLTKVGAICCAASVGFYNAAEAWVDGKSLESTTTNTQVTATTTAKDVVAKALNQDSEVK